MSDLPIVVGFTIEEADCLCRAWAGDDDAINSDATQRAIEAVAESLEAYEANREPS